jgi:hypothetical protein
VVTVKGQLTKTTTGWKVGGLKLVASDLASIQGKDWDGNGSFVSMSDELDGLATAGKAVTLSYTAKPFAVTGFSVG